MGRFIPQSLRSVSLLHRLSRVFIFSALVFFSALPAQVPRPDSTLVTECTLWKEIVQNGTQRRVEVGKLHLVLGPNSVSDNSQQNTRRVAGLSDLAEASATGNMAPNCPVIRLARLSSWRTWNGKTDLPLQANTPPLLSRLLARVPAKCPRSGITRASLRLRDTDSPFGTD